MTQKIAICALTDTLSGCIFANKAWIGNRKKWLNSNISSICRRNMANFGPLTAEIFWRVWGTTANFNGFRVLASLLQRRRSLANQTLHDVRPFSGLIRCLYTFGGSCTLTEFCHVQNSLYVQVVRSPILAALLHGTPAAGVSQTAAWYKEWNYRTFAEGATYIRQGGHHVRHRPTFLVFG